MAGPDGSVLEKDELGDDWCVKRGPGSKNIKENRSEVFQM